MKNEKRIPALITAAIMAMILVLPIGARSNDTIRNLFEPITIGNEIELVMFIDLLGGVIK